ncbi:hypothetical protein TNCV_724641 [Trichonephila clavipes]|nr:hypothetical protein TNCV_724641 [Trichonephila clavipes]
MANNLPTIPAFEAGTNPSESWRHWKEDFEDYLEALQYSEAPEKTKTALFRLEACRELGLIQRLNMIYKSPIETPELILKEFADVFTGTGRLKRIVKIKLKENSAPHVAAP